MSRSKAKTKSKPLPLQTTGGAIIPGEALYIERQEDDELYDALTLGKYCNILTSRQMGKSSLMVWTREQLIEEGYHVVVADMGLIGSQVSSDQWYQGLLKQAVRQLRLSVEVDEWWQSAREATPEARLLSFFRDEIAAKLPGDKPIILFVDEIDGTLELPFSDDFFIAMRAMYNHRAITPEYRRIVFCPVGVASPNELIKDKTKTPYNIGEKIELRDFDQERDDLKPLSQLVGGDETLRQILRFTGGHPYLTVLVSAESVKRKCKLAEDVEALIVKMFASLDDLTGDAHFSYIQDFIAKRAEDPLATLKLYRQIRNGELVKDQITPAHIALKLAGLVKRGPNGTLAVRNEIYRRLFTAEWAAETALKAFAEVNERILREALDDYRPALGAYRSLKNNPAYAGDADELWAQFFERRALHEKQRDETLLWWAQALTVAHTDERARAFGDLLGNDFPRLRMTCRHQGRVAAVSFSPDGRLLLSGSDDCTARLWDAATGQPISQPMLHDNTVLFVAFSPDGRLLLTGCKDGTAHLWKAPSGEPIGQPLRHEGPVNGVAFSPHGDILLTGSADHTARLWDAATRKQIGQPLRHDDFVFAVAFSPDGGAVLTGSWDKTARLWDTATGRQIGLLRHDSYVNAVAFSPDGRTAITGSHDGKARLWDTITGQLIGQPLEHENVVYAVAFSRDGRTALTGGWDKTARLWDTTSGKPVAPPLRHNDNVNAVAFSPDERTLLTGSSDNTARLWDAAIGEPITPQIITQQRVGFETKLNQSDTAALLKEWEQRLAMRIVAGEIVPLIWKHEIGGTSGGR